MRSPEVEAFLAHSRLASEDEERRSFEARVERKYNEAQARVPAGGPGGGEFGSGGGSRFDHVSAALDAGRAGDYLAAQRAISRALAENQKAGRGLSAEQTHLKRAGYHAGQLLALGSNLTGNLDEA